jgi:putative DNA primase/helicase
MDGPKQLADLGLYIEPYSPALNRLKLYVAGQHPKKRARLVGTTGWHQGAYLFPEVTIGKTDKDLVYRGSKRALNTFNTRGSLKQWQEQIARHPNNNWRLMFTLSAALARPLLQQLGAASFAIHWTGDSSIGKSGTLAAAGSVWGNPHGVAHSWRSTDNSLEYVAAQHNDGLLILDELKEVDPKQAGAIAYMLSNAKGKNRAIMPVD